MPKGGMGGGILGGKAGFVENKRGGGGKLNIAGGIVINGEDVGRNGGGT